MLNRAYFFCSLLLSLFTAQQAFALETIRQGGHYLIQAMQPAYTDFGTFYMKVDGRNIVADNQPRYPGESGTKLSHSWYVLSGAGSVGKIQIQNKGSRGCLVIKKLAPIPLLETRSCDAYDKDQWWHLTFVVGDAYVQMYQTVNGVKMCATLLFHTNGSGWTLAPCANSTDEVPFVVYFDSAYPSG